MNKHDAISLFEGQTNLAKALGISRQAVCQWPDVLPQRVADEINGAAIRTGRKPIITNPECRQMADKKLERRSGGMMG